MDRFVRERGSYGFGRFQMDAARRTLTRDGAAVVLTPTVFDTLLYLVENPARVVTKEELLGAIWPGRFVEEFNLTQTIFMLRKVLRDAGEEGRLIVTAPGRGYRFTADVSLAPATDASHILPVASESVPAVLGDENPTADPNVACFADGAPGEMLHISPGTVNARRTEETRRPPPARINRRVALIGGAALPVASAGAGGWLWWRSRARSPPGDKSIVVLPFANLSGDPTQAYLSDGITEEVRDTLATIRGLRVIGRVSSAQVRDMSPRDVGRKLGVSAIVTGSVRRSPTAIRVSAQLIDTTRGDERWSEDYDRAPGDLIAVEDSIAKGVASELEARIGASETFVGTNDPQAHDLYLQAMALVREANDEGTARRALALIDAALQIDSGYVKAHFARADQLWIIAEFATNMADKSRLLAEQEQSVRRGVALAPQWSESYVALAGVLLNKFDFRGAVIQYEKAQRLDPDHISRGSGLMVAMGRSDWDRALTAQAAKVSRDPLNPGVWGNLAFMLYQARHYAKSIAVLKQTLAWAPKQVELNYGLALSLLCLGRSREALDAVSMFADDGEYKPFTQAIAYWRLGDRPASDDALARLNRHVYTAAYEVAMARAQRGEVEAALASLDDAWRFGDPGLWALSIDPMLDPLRKEPRFKALLAKLGFP